MIQMKKKIIKGYSPGFGLKLILQVLFLNLALSFPFSLQAQQASSALQITSPGDGTIVSSGSLLSVAISLTAGTNFSQLAIIGEEMGIHDIPAGSSTVTYSLQIPKSLVGKKKLTAVGMDNSRNFYFSPSVTIDIEPTSSLTQLVVTPTLLSFRFAGSQLPLNVEGIFSDGSTLDLTRSSLTTFISNDPTVAAVDSQGMVTAIGQGTTTTTKILVQNNSLTATVLVTVPKSIPGDFNRDGVVTQDDLNILMMYLNHPATGPFDARDLNHDGMIDLLDAQALTALCAKPCAIPAGTTDTIPPTTTASSSPMPNENGWNNTNVSVSLSAVDNPGGSGVKAIYYRIGSSPKVTVPGSQAMFTLTSEGIYTVQYNAVDNAGNTEAVHTMAVKIDKTPPTVTFGPASPPPNAAGWNNTNVSIPFSAADNLSGVAGTSVASPLVLSTEGSAVTGTVTVTDLAGNSATFFTSPVKIDKTPPAVSVTRTPLANRFGWNNTDVTAHFTATDSLSGVQGATTVDIVFSKEGANQSATQTFTDVAGNSISATITEINIDKTPPEAFMQFDPVSQDIQLFGRDSLSGVNPGPANPTTVVLSMQKAEDQDDRSSESEDREGKELRTYHVADLAGNTLILVESVKRDGHEIKAQAVSAQYNSQPLLALPRNKENFEWDFGKISVPKELEQNLETGLGRSRQELEAKFNRERNLTIIKREEPKPETRIVKPGLVLLRLVTEQGKLLIEY